MEWRNKMGRVISGAVSSGAAVEIGQIQEFSNGEDIILDGKYVKANGQLLDKAEFSNLYSVIKDSGISDLDYTISIGSVSNGVYGSTALDQKLRFCKVGTKFCLVASTDVSEITSVSVSEDGETWSVPSVPGAIPTGTFYGIRSFGEDIFICHSTGLYRSTDYGATFTPLYTNASIYDIAYNGSMYVFTTNTLQLFKTENFTVISPVTTTNPYVSIVWAGTHFVAHVGNNTAIGRSTDAITWTTSHTTTPYVDATTSGNRMYYINGNIIRFSSSSYSFEYSSNAGLTWARSNLTYLSGYECYIEWDGTNYIMVRPSGGTNLVYKMPTLGAVPVSYTLPALSSQMGFCLYNNTKYFYAMNASSSSGYVFVKDSPPTENISEEKLFMHIFSTISTLSDGVLIVGSTSTANPKLLYVYKYSNHKYTLLKASETVYSFGTGNSFAHYAKDCGMLYYTTGNYGTSMPVSRRPLDLDTGVFGQELTVAICSGITEAIRTYRHSNGVFFDTGAANGNTAFVGSTYKTRVTAPACSNIHMSYGGKRIFMTETASPYSLFVSTDGGLTFNNTSSTLYNEAGSVIAKTLNNSSILYKNGKYYTKRDNGVGYSPASLKSSTENTISAAFPTIEIADGLIVSNNNAGTIVNAFGFVASSYGVTNSNVGYQKYDNGNIFVASSTGVGLYAITLDASKFKVNNIPSTSFNRAYYIKAN